MNYIFSTVDAKVLFSATLDNARIILNLHEGAVARIKDEVAGKGNCHLFFGNNSNCFRLHQITVTGEAR